MIDWMSVLEVLTPLGTALMLGGLLGLEREVRGHVRGRSAGLRTHMLVSLGAAMFVSTCLSVSQNSASDVSRVIQGIAAGVGFIGAGTILKLTDQMEVKGLTTASTVWLAAATGTAAGARLYLVAVCGTLLAVPVLTVLGFLERRYERNESRE